MGRPYTPRQLRLQPCLRCDAPASTQWRACADGTYRALCAACDVGLNEMILRWFGMPDAEMQIERYRVEMLGASLALRAERQAGLTNSAATNNSDIPTHGGAHGSS